MTNQSLDRIQDRAPSAIDITAVPRRWADLSSWKADDFPTSDRHVITTTVETTIIKEAPKRRKWALKPPDWSKFRKELDIYLLKHSTQNIGINRENDILVTGIQNAARKLCQEKESLLNCHGGMKKLNQQY